LDWQHSNSPLSIVRK